MALAVTGQCAFAGGEMRRRRKANDQRAEDTAVRVGISTKTLYFWESGRTVPSANDVARLAAAFGCHPGDFYLPR